MTNDTPTPIPPAPSRRHAYRIRSQRTRRTKHHLSWEIHPDQKAGRIRRIPTASSNHPPRAPHLFAVWHKRHAIFAILACPLAAMALLGEGGEGFTNLVMDPAATEADIRDGFLSIGYTERV